MYVASGNNLPRIKALNQSTIREIIYHYGPISRSEIAGRLSLALPTITGAINNLLNAGFIREVSPEAGEKKVMGRKVALIDIIEDFRLFLGVEIRGTCRCACVTDYRGNVLFSAKDDEPCLAYEEAVGKTVRMIQELFAEHQMSLEQVSGICVCLPGLVDVESGVLKLHPGYGWKNKDIRGDITRLLGYHGTVLVENNACARTYAMRLFHQAELEEAKTFAYLFVSLGIACHFVHNEIGPKMFSPSSGEAGHMVMDPDGPICSCGNHGCLEAFSSEKAIVARCRELLERGRMTGLRYICADPTAPTIAEILQAQEEGDIYVSQILDTAIYYLGVAIANIYNFISPHRMVIECSLFQSEKNRKQLLDVIHQNLYTATITDVHFTFMPPDEFSGAMGATAVAIQNDLMTYIE